MKNLIDANKTYLDLIDAIDWLREQDYDLYSHIGDEIRYVISHQERIEVE